MAFSTSQAQRASEIGAIVWNTPKKTPDLPAPNIRFYDKNTNATTYLVAEGSKRSPQVIGAIRRFSVKQVEGYTDRETKTGAESLFRAFLTLDSGPNEPLSTLVFDILDQAANRADMNSMQLINSLYAHLQLVKSGQLDGSAPVMISLYRNAKDFPASAIIRSSGTNEAGVPEFADFKGGLIRSEQMVPLAEKVIVNGQPLMVNGFPVYDYTKAREYTEPLIGELIEHYSKVDPTDAEQQAQQDAESAGHALNAGGDEGEADLAGVVAETAGATRQRMAG